MSMFLTFLNGDTMPIVGLGTWKAGRDETYRIIRNAIELGYRHFDCASLYGNEAQIGQALQDAMSAGEVTREQLWITSKLWNDAHLRKHVEPAMRQTLGDLQLDYLDLYLVHWPVAIVRGTRFPSSPEEFMSLEEAPLATTWSEIERLHNLGLAKHIGVSNFTATKLKSLLTECSLRPEMNQVEAHPFLAQYDLLKYCHHEQIHMTAYSPLGSSIHVKEVLGHPTIRDIALRTGMTPAQVLIRWSVDRGVAVIPKSASLKHLKQNLDVLNFELSQQDMDTLDGLDENRRFVTGSLWTIEGSPYSADWLWND